MLDAVKLYNHAERARALPAFVRAALTGEKADDRIAADLAEEGVSLRHLVQSFDPKPDAAGDWYSRATGSSDLAAGLAQTIAALALPGYDALAEWQKILWRVQVANFKPSSFAQLGLSPLAVTRENGAILPLKWHGNTDSLETVGLDAHSHYVAVTRAVITGDQVGMLQSLSQQVGQAVARTVATSIADALESSDTLADGRTWFNTTDGNLASSGAAPSVGTLNAAVQALRAMPDAAGNPAGIPPRYLVVPSALEASARTLVAATFGPSEWLEVVCVPTLSSATAWYLLPSPAAMPAIGLLSLNAANRPLFTLDRAPRRIESDAVEFKLFVDYRVARVSRFAYKNAGA